MKYLILAALLFIAYRYSNRKSLTTPDQSTDQYTDYEEVE